MLVLSASKVARRPAMPTQDHAPRVMRVWWAVTYSMTDPPGAHRAVSAGQ